jgi:hypothetical protein
LLLLLWVLQLREGLLQMKITQSQLRQIVEQELEEVIRKLPSGKYRLYSKKKNPKTGERRNLGTFDSRKAAEEHEKDVQYFKHMGEGEVAELDEKKKKKKKKDDRCTRIAKRKYDVWPSAYASGAVVKCRQGKIWKGVKEGAGEEEDLERKIRKALRDEGGAAGMDALVKHTDASEVDIRAAIEEMDDVGRHEDGDYILDDGEAIDVIDEDLRKWFGRKGTPGKKGGWVDCNAPIYKKGKKVGYKACGRQKGEKRSKYPACRPTAAACKSKGKGKKWGKKAAKKKKTNEVMQIDANMLERIVRQELQEALFLPGLKHHVQNGIPVSENIYRPGSPCYFNVIKQARDFYNMGLYEVINEEERDLLENTDLGEWVVIEGERIPLGFPMFEDESLDEAKKKKKKDPPIGKPTRNTGSGKKYKVFVRNPKTGKIKKITYGDAKGGLKGDWNSAEARKSFAARHKCAEKKDRTKAGYWACRAHKDFGPGVGRFW